jgi:hypothetical protein
MIENIRSETYESYRYILARRKHTIGDKAKYFAEPAFVITEMLDWIARKFALNRKCQHEHFVVPWWYNTYHTPIL